MLCLSLLVITSWDNVCVVKTKKYCEKKYIKKKEVRRSEYWEDSTHRESKLDSVNSDGILHSSSQNNSVIKQAHFVCCSCRYVVDRVVDTAIVVLFKECIGEKVTHQSICKLQFHSLFFDNFWPYISHTFFLSITYLIFPNSAKKIKMMFPWNASNENYFIKLL